MKKEYYKLIIWNILSKEKANELLEKLRKELPETTIELQQQSFGKKI